MAGCAEKAAPVYLHGHVKMAMKSKKRTKYRRRNQWHEENMKSMAKSIENKSVSG